MIAKKLTCLLVATLVALQPLTSHAVDLNSAFNNLLGSGSSYALSKPGRFQSQARNGFSAGGMEMRVPRSGNVPQLFSVDPPTGINIGCNGISAHFGGFSFISGKEFEKLLKMIGSGAALGFVSSLALKTLCPPCEAVVQEMKAAAQMASQLARNACQWGKDAGDKFWAGLATEPDKTSKCSMTEGGGGDENGASDSQGAYEKLCSTVEDASSALVSSAERSAESAKGSALTEDEKAAIREKAECEIGDGNRTWMRLAAFDQSGAYEADSNDNYHRKLLLLNILGAELSYSADGVVACEEEAGTHTMAASEKPWYCKPTMESKTLMAYFMCGTPDAIKKMEADGKASSSVVSYCQSFFPANTKGEQDKIWWCKGGEDSITGMQARKTCAYLERTNPANIFTGKGILQHVNELLLDAVDRVRRDRGFNDAQGKDILRLIQVSPYPLYQAINAAAVYPAAAQDLMDNMSVLVAEQYVYANFDEFLRINGRSSGGACIGPTQAEKLVDFITKLRGAAYERKSLMAQNYALQSAVIEQIRQINVTIQKQTINSDLLGNAQMTDSFNKAIGQSMRKTEPVTTP